MTDEVNRETGEVISVSYRRSVEIKELFTALAKAQAEFGSAEKSGKGNFGTYATLESILEATKEGRDHNSLALIQVPSNGDQNMITVTTLLGHSSGQWLESTLGVAPVKFDAQGVGSVITYLRRYAAGAILGVAPEDDDGEAAVREPDRTSTTKGSTRTARPTATAAPPTASQTTAAAANRRGNATSATQSPGPSSTGNNKTAAREMFVKSFLDGDNYEIDPTKPGGWATWEKIYLGVADYTDSEGQLAKMQHDNRDHIPKYHKAHGEEHYQWFCGRIADNAKRLQMQEAVTPAETQDVLMD